MDKNKLLATAIKVAVEDHDGQFDKGGAPYILHPMHLMNQVMFDTELAIIAVLHDVFEDSSMDFNYLESLGFSERVLTALDLLTHYSCENYIKVYIKKICSNYDAIRVKRKDLEHNSDITRLKGLSAEDFKRIKKYHKAFQILGEAKKAFIA